MTLSAAYLLDAPTTVQTKHLHRIAKLGTFNDKRYGTFTIDRATVASWQRNLSSHQDGRVPIDVDHSSDRPGGSSEAYGWIVSLELVDTRDGTYVVAEVEWTDKGRDAIRNKRWLYFSPAFVDHLRDEQGKDLGPALMGAALTNRPFLRQGMPIVSLSAAAPDERFASETQPKEATMATTLDRRPEQVIALQSAIDKATTLSREDGVDFVTALSQAGALDLAQTMRAGDPTPPIPAAENTDPEARMRAIFEESEALKAALGADLSTLRNTEIIERHIEVLETGPRLDVPPHLTLRRLPVNPDSPDDFKRDRRRAERAGVMLDETDWEAYAVNGEDAVYVLFEKARLATIARLKAARDNLNAHAREAEASRTRRERARETLLTKAKADLAQMDAELAHLSHEQREQRVGYVAAQREVERLSEPLLDDRRVTLLR